MKLFFSPNSPYARKCRAVIIEKNLTGIEQIKVDAMSNPPELLAVNPLGTVPSFATDAGLYLCESPIICEFLDDLPSNAPKLIPDDVGARLCAMALGAFADGVMDAAVVCVVEGRRPAEKQWGATIERKEAAIMRAIAKIASVNLSNDFAFSMGTLNTAIALEYVSFRLPHLKWNEKHPELAAWLAVVSARKSMMETRPS